MTTLRTIVARRVLALAVMLLAVPWPTGATQKQDEKEKEAKKPGLSLKATPSVSFSPARVLLVAELKGGPDDYEDYYCAGAEWDWGDGTASESSADCEPYEAGKSEIKRRFSTTHVFRYAGNYRVQFRLKRKNKVLANANASIQVRPGLRDPTVR